MSSIARAAWVLLSESWQDFGKDECTRLAAALSYYTVFSLPPLLVLLVTIASVLWDPREVQGSIERQIVGLLGAEGGAQVRTIMQSADRRDSNRPLAAVVGIGALLFGAEFTEAWSRQFGKGIVPEEGAVKVEIRTEHVEAGPDAHPKADTKASSNAGTKLEQ